VATLIKFLSLRTLSVSKYLLRVIIFIWQR
jgi:hypothetical protein